jgi:putative ABC transport system permease protein
MIWKIAFRNLVKNARRSVTTALAIGVGGVAALLLGGFVTSIWFGVQTSIIQEQGNLQVYREGYLEYGAANPEDYTILDWTAAAEAILADPGLAAEITVLTPRIDLVGIAGNAQSGNSQTFVGRGIVPQDVDRMRQWDGWHIGDAAPATGLAGAGPDSVIVGIGMARLLGVCDALAVEGCTDRPAPADEADAGGEGAAYADLVAGDADLAAIAEGDAGKPVVNLMAATSDGVPNIVRATIDAAQPQSVRALDNAFVMMSFGEAQRLLYGDRPEATALMIQVADPARADAVKARVQEVLDKAGLGLVAYHFTEVDPTFGRIFGMFGFIFVVVSTVLAIVIVFTIVNTVSMNIVERVKEIGTIRAIGFRRSFVRRMFLAESALTGLFGAAIAVGLAAGLAAFVNAAGVQWTPPSNATPLTVRLMVLENPLLAGSVALGLTLIAVAASILPTFRASRLNIVESLQRA